MLSSLIICSARAISSALSDLSPALTAARQAIEWYIHSCFSVETTFRIFRKTFCYFFNKLGYAFSVKIHGNRTNNNRTHAEVLGDYAGVLRSSRLSRKNGIFGLSQRYGNGREQHLRRRSAVIFAKLIKKNSFVGGVLVDKQQLLPTSIIT